MIQVAFAFFGVMAVFMMYTPNERLKRWSPVVGLAGQPFWAAFAYTTQPTPWGLVFTCVVFSLAFSYGIWRMWSAPKEPQFVMIANIQGIDEYGPYMLWHRHWVELDGRELYIKE